MRPRWASGSSVTGTPSQESWPRIGLSSPAMTRSRLDLPLPLGPSRNSASPGAIRKSSPVKTSRSPRRQVSAEPAKTGMAAGRALAVDGAGGAIAQPVRVPKRNGLTKGRAKQKRLQKETAIARGFLRWPPIQPGPGWGRRKTGALIVA
ncbi:protein of unknown function [Azospirillum baldaniorum]|uniref:Uncharacterized protein n=1 Tax=Azospirillum baldaniorum TaxID=1064539 RepID=A0A9P1NKB5_9PROT|nr:protein of unknown function [Azospirillum baldaniorum]